LASNALNLITPHIRTSSNLESPWLPNGKICRGAFLRSLRYRWCSRRHVFRDDSGVP
jgi:hypothetical protein